MTVKAPEKGKIEEFIYVDLPPDLVVSDNAKGILRKAYELIRRPRGWTKGTFSSYMFLGKKGYPAHCVVGAIYEASDYSSEDINATRESINAFTLAIGKATEDDIYRWNDEKRRKKDHVLRVFEELIKD